MTRGVLLLRMRYGLGMAASLAAIATASLAICAAPCASGAASGRGRPYVSLRLLGGDRFAALRDRRVRVRVCSVVAARVRLRVYAKPLAGLAAASRVVAAARVRTVVLRARRPRTFALRLTGMGLRALRSCSVVRLDVVASPRRLHQVQHGGRNGLKLNLISRRATRRFAAERERCRGGILPGPAGGYLVGVAIRSINPAADGTFAGQRVYLGGYGIASPPATTGRPATGVLGRGVSVRAIAVADGKHATAIADIEAQGYFVAQRDAPYGLADLRRAVAQRSGGALRPSDVIVQSDHSHSGPDLMGVWGGAPIEYRRYVFAQTVDALLEAYRNRRDGTLYYGTADGRDLLSNQFDYDPSNHVVDSDVRVLQARDEHGRTFATLLNFSAHATVLGSSNTKASGDWVQEANPLLEQRFGGRAMTMVGTLGRTQPADRSCPDKALQGDAQSLCTLDDYAGRVVDRAGQAVANAKAILGDPVVAARSYLIQDVTSNPVLLGLLVAGGPVGAPLNRSLVPPWSAANLIGTVTGSVRIGDVLISAIPGEAYPQIALAVHEIARAPRGFMTAGLANDQLGYLIAPYVAYPEPIRRSFFNQRGDQISPLDNDNYFFNVSQTMGQRVQCSLLRGAGELFGHATQYRDADGACLPFVNDALSPPGADAG